MTPLRQSILCLALAGLAGAAPARAEPEPQTRPAARPRIVALSQVLADLKQEAEQAWARHTPWPRRASDYALTQNVTAPDDEVVRPLTRALHANAAIDGYLKWQLLSLRPDLGGQEPRVYRQIIAALPAIAPQPEPHLEPPPAPAGGTGVGVILGDESVVRRDVVVINPRRPKRIGLNVVTSGSVLTSDGLGAPGGAAQPIPPSVVAAVAQRAQAQLQSDQAIAGEINLPALAYRDRLMELLPREAGVRLAGLATDLRQRMEAGDPSWPLAVERLALEAEAFGKAPPDDDFRRSIAADLHQIARLRKAVAQSVAAEEGVPRVLVERAQVEVPAEILVGIVRALGMEQVLRP